MTEQTELRILANGEVWERRGSRWHMTDRVQCDNLGRCQHAACYSPIDDTVMDSYVDMVYVQVEHAHEDALRTFNMIVADDYQGHWSSFHSTEAAYGFLVHHDHKAPLPASIARDRN